MLLPCGCFYCPEVGSFSCFLKRISVGKSSCSRRLCVTGSDHSQGCSASVSKAQKGSARCGTPDEHPEADLLLLEGLPDLGLSLALRGLSDREATNKRPLRTNLHRELHCTPTTKRQQQPVFPGLLLRSLWILYRSCRPPASFPSGGWEGTAQRPPVWSARTRGKPCRPPGSWVIPQTLELYLPVVLYGPWTSEAGMSVMGGRQVP